MSFEQPPGHYALLHANGMSWTDVLKKHRVHVQADALVAAKRLREEREVLLVAASDE